MAAPHRGASGPAARRRADARTTWVRSCAPPPPSGSTTSGWAAPPCRPPRQDPEDGDRARAVPRPGRSCDGDRRRRRRRSRRRLPAGRARAGGRARCPCTSWPWPPTCAWPSATRTAACRRPAWPLRRPAFLPQLGRARLAQRGHRGRHRPLRGPPPGLDRAADRRPLEPAELAATDRAEPGGLGSEAEGVDRDAEAARRGGRPRPARPAGRRGRAPAPATAVARARATSTGAPATAAAAQAARRTPAPPGPTPRPGPRPAGSRSSSPALAPRPRPPGPGRRAARPGAPRGGAGGSGPGPGRRRAPPADQPGGPDQQGQGLLGGPVARGQQLLVEVEEGHHVGRRAPGGARPRCRRRPRPSGRPAVAGRWPAPVTSTTGHAGQRLQLLAHPGHAGPQVLEARWRRRPGRLGGRAVRAAAALEAGGRRSAPRPPRSARSGRSRRRRRRPAAGPGPCG